MLDKKDERDYRLTAAVRDACIRVALEAYENAGISGLCHEGRWEVAVDEMRQVDLDRLIRELDTTPAKTSSTPSPVKEPRWASPK